MSAFGLDGRHVVVTGGGRGLGRAMASACAQAGAKVTIVARNSVELEQTALELRSDGATIRTIAFDLADLDKIPELARMAQDDGPVDSVVNSAGVQIRRDAGDFTVAEWEMVQRINLSAPYFLTSEIAREQRAEGRSGSHVFIGSLSATIGLPRVAAYAASKSGLLGVVRTLAGEWAAEGIRVNALSPGYFFTDLTDDLLSRPEQRQRIEDRIPMKRLGDPTELGGALVFLLSDASGYITGQMINVDGGWLSS